MILVTNYCAPRAIQEKINNLGHEVLFTHHKISDPFFYREFLDSIDGLVLSGGEDVNPSLYNEENTHSWFGDGKRDSFELEVLGDFFTNFKKILGICRGHQLLNVYFGGTLYQDIDIAGFRHSGEHLVELSGEGQQLFGRERMHTNSLHHQAVKDVADTFEVIGKHPDGTIEAIYSEGAGCLGVQFHPEMMEGSDEVFEWLTN